MTYSEIRKNEEVLTFIKKGNANLGAMGFTDHSEAHSGLVAERAAEILKKFGYPEKDIELVKIAGFMHDIGNAVNRSHHAEYGALIIADKTDVRRSRVREKNKATFDKHDRVNYAVTDTRLKINVEKRVISLNLKIDPKICSMYEYFEIFLGRMMMCKRAAEVLEASFKLTVNGSKVL